MSTATKEDHVDEARDALVSDIHDLKSAGASALAKGESKLPWIIGGVAGLVIVGLAVRALKPRRHELFAYQQPSLLGKAVRAAALAATGIVARRYMERLVNQALPERTTATASPSPPPAPAAKST